MATPPPQAPPPPSRETDVALGTLLILTAVLLIVIAALLVWPLWTRRVDLTAKRTPLAIAAKHASVVRDPRRSPPAFYIAPTQLNSLSVSSGLSGRGASMRSEKMFHL